MEAWDEVIAEMDSYKYLGVEFDKGLTFSELKARLADKARKNRTMAWNMGLNKARLTAKAGVNTWTTLVRPSLEYGAQVWGDRKWESAEIIQREMGRKILRCNSRTANAAVRGELGWWTMCARRDLLKLRYWIHILLAEDDRLIKKIYKHSKIVYQSMRKNNWTKTIHELVKKYNLSYLWDNENLVSQLPENYRGETTSYWSHIIWSNIHNIEAKKWKEEMERKTKLRYYKVIKKDLEMEKYLISESNAYHRKIFTLFRIGAYQLRIETGRWNEEDRGDRLCLKCMNGDVEDELHFLFECNAYDVPRRELYKNLRKKRLGWNPEEMRKERNWSMLMNGLKPAVNSTMIQFIKAAIEIRNRL